MSSICSKDIAGEHVAFLTGAGRSGTTLLYKLLCLHPELAYMSNYDNRLPWLYPGLMSRLVSNKMEAKLKAWFDQGGNAYLTKRAWAKKFFPIPVEGESIYGSCGMPPSSTEEHHPDDTGNKCLREHFDRIRRAMKAEIFLTKRTTNNWRLSQVDVIFPRARYVNLIRDGRDVAHSLSKVEWWDKHVLWWDGRTAEELERTGEDRLSICARNWTYEMQALRVSLAAVEPARIYEVRYERILADPLVELAGILDFLGLPLISSYQKAIKSLQLTSRPSTWIDQWTPGQIESVLGIERSLLDELGYL